MTEPRVVAFIGSGPHPLGAAALRIASAHLVGIVANDGAGFIDYLDPEHATADAIAELLPTHGISAGYRSIIRPDVIACFPNGIVNVHTSLLPFGRGANPNAWAIANRTPSGVTLHLIDAGVDTGPILVQEEVPVSGDDTAGSLQAKLTARALEMMGRHLPAWIREPALYPPQAQGGIAWDARRKSDLDSLLCLYPRAAGVIDILRARTCHPWPGALYTDPEGRRWRVRVEISPA